MLAVAQMTVKVVGTGAGLAGTALAAQGGHRPSGTGNQNPMQAGALP